MRIYPSFSPDGTQVAFQWCTQEPAVNCDIYVKQIDVEPPSRLTTDPAEDFSPAWSPDGQTIAFLRRHSATRTLLILIPQRGGPERVLGECDIAYENLTAYPAELLAWTLDSKWLVVPRMKDVEPLAGLSLFNVETRETRRLTTHANDQAPAISPDGRTLAFGRYDGGRQLIYFLRLSEGYHTEGEPEHVAPVAESYNNFGTAWSPDGKEIVFSSGYSANAGLWRVAASAGARPRRLAFASEGAFAPAVSRKGDRLAYVVDRADANIWRIDLGGPGQKPGTAVRLIASTREDSSPAYSPDGRTLAFNRDISGPQLI
jgi:Tol biopolymer transport system component